MNIQRWIISGMMLVIFGATTGFWAGSHFTQSQQPADTPLAQSYPTPTATVANAPSSPLPLPPTTAATQSAVSESLPVQSTAELAANIGKLNSYSSSDASSEPNSSGTGTNEQPATATSTPAPPTITPDAVATDSALQSLIQNAVDGTLAAMPAPTQAPTDVIMNATATWTPEVQSSQASPTWTPYQDAIATTWRCRQRFRLASMLRSLHCRALPRHFQQPPHTQRLHLFPHRRPICKPLRQQCRQPLPILSTPR